MAALRTFIKRIPGALWLYRFLFMRAEYKFLKNASAETIFTRYYEGNEWGSDASLSGPGSVPSQTQVIAEELQRLLEALNISTLLDIPCGDFAWMRTVSLGKIRYIGADIVAPAVRRNQERYGSDRVSFEHLDITTANLPKVDMVLCRDCLVHLSNAEVLCALRNICRSGSTHLLTTTFTEFRENKDILTGCWRPINLEKSPFSFPPPLKLINEQCTEKDGQYADKSLGLWRIKDLEDQLFDTPKPAE